MKPLRPVVVLPLLVLALVVASVVAIGLGPVRLPPSTVAATLWQEVSSPFDQVPPAATLERRIVVLVRLPRMLLATIVGAALAIAGTAFQGLLRNPLADPFILGTSSGAALAATIVIATGVGSMTSSPLLLPAASFAGSLLALIAVYALARTSGRVPIETLLLSGVIMNAFLFALVLLVLAKARLEAVEILLWLMGSLALGVGTELLAVVALLTTVGGVAVWVMSRDLDVMSLGEEQASLLGVDTERLKRRLFVVVSLIVGAAVSVSGIIGFVGLIVPHLARMIIGPAHRTLLPAAALLGALGLVVADTVARTALPPVGLPVGVVTALTGAPFFMWLLRRSRRAL